MDPVFAIIILYATISFVFMEIKTGCALFYSPNTRIKPWSLYYRKENPLQYWATILFQCAANCVIVFTATDFKKMALFKSEEYIAISAIIFFLTSFQVFLYYYYYKLKKKS